MRRLLAPAIAVVCAVALVALLIFGVLQTSDDSSLDQAVARGDRPAAPDASLPLLDGDGARSIADLRGGYVVVNFFADWCGPCHEEAPLLEEVQRRLAAQGGTVFGVSWNDSAQRSRAFVKRYGLTFPVVRDLDNKLGDGYGIKALPETFVVDPDGRVVAMRRGQLTEEWVRDRLDPLLAARQAQ